MKVIIKTSEYGTHFPSNAIAAIQARDILWAVRYVSSNLPTNPTPPLGWGGKQNLRILYLSLLIFSFHIFISTQRGQEGKEEKEERKKKAKGHPYLL